MYKKYFTQNYTIKKNTNDKLSLTKIEDDIESFLTKFVSNNAFYDRNKFINILINDMKNNVLHELNNNYIFMLTGSNVLFNYINKMDIMNENDTECHELKKNVFIRGIKSDIDTKIIFNLKKNDDNDKQMFNINMMKIHNYLIENVNKYHNQINFNKLIDILNDNNNNNNLEFKKILSKVFKKFEIANSTLDENKKKEEIEYIEITYNDNMFDNISNNSRYRCGIVSKYNDFLNNINNNSKIFNMKNNKIIERNNIKKKFNAKIVNILFDSDNDFGH